MFLSDAQKTVIADLKNNHIKQASSTERKKKHLYTFLYKCNIYIQYSISILQSAIDLSAKYADSD